MGQIRKGEYCSGCGQICDGRHLDKDLRPTLASQPPPRAAESALAAAQGALREARATLLPMDGVSPDWMLKCTSDHVNNLAGDPSRWSLCVGCVRKAIDAALAAESDKETRHDQTATPVVGRALLGLGGPDLASAEALAPRKDAVAVESGKPGGDRERALEEALVRLLETQTWSFSDEQAAAIDHACDNVLHRRVEPKEPRAAPPALPAELSGKGEQPVTSKELDELGREGSGMALLRALPRLLASARREQRARALLKRIEWSGNLGQNSYGCAECDFEERSGHAPGCELAALIAGEPGEAKKEKP